MRKFAFALPMCAIILAAAVLISELGGAVSASTPATSAVPEWVDVEGIAIDPNDPNAALWVETAGKAVKNSRNPKLPKQKNNVPAVKNNLKK